MKLSLQAKWLLKTIEAKGLEIMAGISQSNNNNNNKAAGRKTQSLLVNDLNHLIFPGALNSKYRIPQP